MVRGADVSARKMPMQRAHKIRLNPTHEQEQWLLQACGVARFCYNWVDILVLGGIIERGRNQDIKEGIYHAKIQG